MKMREVKYVCSDSDCEAEDNPKFYAAEQIPSVINCWKCHAGLNKPVNQMLMEHVGMFPQLENARGTSRVAA